MLRAGHINPRPRDDSIPKVPCLSPPPPLVQSGEMNTGPEISHLQDFNNLEFLRYLFEIRYSQRLLDLASSLQRKLGEGKVRFGHVPGNSFQHFSLQSLFDVWMKQESDAIQDTAKAYAHQGRLWPYAYGTGTNIARSNHRPIRRERARQHTLNQAYPWRPLSPLRLGQY